VAPKGNGTHTKCRSVKLLLALASTIILGSESGGTHGHILMFQDPVSRVKLSPQNVAFNKTSLTGHTAEQK
jgi:hypothetical protein